MTIRRNTIGRVPTLAGAWDASYVNPKTGHNGYPQKKRVTHLGSEFESLIEDNTYAPATLNQAGTQITFDTEHWLVISNGTDAYLLQNTVNEKLEEIDDVKDAIEAEQASQRESMATMQNTINAKQLEIGAVQTDPVPTQNSGNHMTSGDIYQTLKDSSKGFVDNVPAPDSDKIAKSGGILNSIIQNGPAFDLSAYNDGEKYADLAEALTALNSLPSVFKKGGMSVKFVQSSDNKYVQYRLMAQSFTTDTTQWAIAEEGVYVENPEFVYVKTDKDDKILWAIKTDGGIYYGAGVPQQVVDYINEKIAELSLDEYEDIVAFLNGLESGEKTLSQLLAEKADAETVIAALATKVDKVEGKSLIDEDVAAGVHYIENPEFAGVWLDGEGKILFGVQTDGNFLFGYGVPKQVKDYIEEKISSLSLDEYEDIVAFLSDYLGSDTTLKVMIDGINERIPELIDNPEFAGVWLDGEGKILFGVQTDGNFLFGYGVPKQVKDYIEEKISSLSLDEYEDIVAFLSDYLGSDTTLKVMIDGINERIPELIDNPEFIEVKTDSEGKLLAGRTSDGAAFENVGFSTPKVSIDGHVIKNIEDPEGRSEITTDSEDKIISYRDSEGVKHEEVGIVFTKNGASNLKEQLNTVPVDKHWYLPKFGKVNIKSETFYLTADTRWSTKDDVVCIQMLDDTYDNALQKKHISDYYIKSTLTPLAGGGYDKTSVTTSSVKLDFYPARNISAVNNKYYVTATLEDGAVVQSSIEVTAITDVPPYKAWPINKDKHLCVADIDFGTFYTKTNVPIELSFQGNTTLLRRKKGFRITFYKKSDYKKKDKIKIGEMVRLSGFNMKAYDEDASRIRDPFISNLAIEVWESRGKECYPWNADSVPFNGATGMIKAFPIEMWFDEEFYGLQLFGLKKDEKNYMLDGDDDASGIFVSGDTSLPDMWTNATPKNWADEMGVKSRPLAYPELGDDSVSVETAAAMEELFKYIKGFIDSIIYKDSNNTVYNVADVTKVDTSYYVTATLVDGNVTAESIEVTEYAFNNFMLEEHINLAGWIDYWIITQVFQLWDNVQHNMILHTRKDKKLFYPFFYDLDVSLNYQVNFDVSEYVVSRGYDNSFWDKFTEEYKDSIINRYSVLRKSILTDNNFLSIYHNLVDGIPENVIKLEKTRWAGCNPTNFSAELDLLQRRIKWLDEIYFNL